MSEITIAHMTNLIRPPHKYFSKLSRAWMVLTARTCTSLASLANTASLVGLLALATQQAQATEIPLPPAQLTQSTLATYDKALSEAKQAWEAE